MFDHRVPAPAFGCIQRRVRGLDQIVLRLGAARRDRRDAHADGDVLEVAGDVRNRQFFDFVRTFSATCSERAALLFGSNKQNSSPP